MGSSLLRGKHSQAELIAQEENEGFTLTPRLSHLPPPFRELQLQRCWGPFEEPKPWQQPRLPEKPWRGQVTDGRDGIFILQRGAGAEKVQLLSINSLKQRELCPERLYVGGGGDIKHMGLFSPYDQLHDDFSCRSDPC